MCDCISKAEEAANDRFKEKISGIKNAVITEQAIITTRALILSSPARQVVTFPVEGKYMIGKQRNTFKMTITPGFCPFCGESLTDKK